MDAGQARGRGARQAGTRCRRAADRHAGHDKQARDARQARGARPTGWPGRGLGVQLGQWAVHLVHSACFLPSSTRYFPESNFWTLFVNSVHEHCSSQKFSEKKNLLNSNKIK